jgi:ubiquinone/menaquinone biosynthesis C-methylase UbiE
MNSTSLEGKHIHEAYGVRAATDARYSFFDQGQLFRIHQLERGILASLRLHGLEPLHSRRILEVGCGTGYWLRQFIQWGARPENLTGVDLLAERVAEAMELCPPQVKIHRANAATLHFAEGTFDLVFQATLFTSIFDPDIKHQIAAEMMRVTKRDGLILWYDFRVNNPSNADVQGVRSREIQKLFPSCDITLHRVTLAPPLVRRLARYSWVTCYLLEKIPSLCTHYLGVIRKQVTPGIVSS